jgi:hypothetical protein
MHWYADKAWHHGLVVSSRQHLNKEVGKDLVTGDV